MAEAGKSGALSDIVLVTIPAVMTYLIGWAYLHYYLSAFGIEESELELDLETILVYAAPPLSAVFGDHWVLWVLFIVVALIARAMIDRQRRKAAAAAAAAGVPAPVVHDTREPLVHGLVALALLIVLVRAAVPYVKDLAQERARDRWERLAVRIQTVLKEGEPRSGAQKNYATCLEQGRLDLLFADRNRYFMLCRSTVDTSVGLIFEVARDEAALVSVREARRHP